MQNIVIIKSTSDKFLMIRGKELTPKMARTYGEYYMGNIDKCIEINGTKALAHAVLFGTKILDIDDNSIV